MPVLGEDGGLPASLVETLHVQRAKRARIELHRVQLPPEVTQVTLRRRGAPGERARPPAGGEGMVALAGRRC